MLALAQARSTQRHSLLLSLSRAAPSVFSSASLVPATQLDTFKHSYSTSRSGSSSSSSTAHLAPPPATKPDASVTAVAPHHQLPHQQQLVDNDKRRRGFGGKVVPPAEHELQQVVVAATLDDEEPLTFRAYHVGSRVHIGRVLKHVRSAQPNCQITAGKDYCLLWLPSRGVDAAPFAPSTAILNSLWSRFSSYQTPPNNTPSLQRETIITTMNKLWAESMRVPATPPVQAEQQQQSPPHPKVKQLPVMAVYRSGAVVFAGLPEREDIVWMSHLVPPPVRYTGPERGQWLQAFLPTSVLPTVTPIDAIDVVVDPALTAEAVKGDDELRLRVLDVGAVRVLTAVLAQSASLQFYEESVNNSLKRLSDWRAAHASRSGSGSSSSSVLFAGMLSSNQDKVLFKVIAASALVLSQAQELLQVAEPAWQFDAYSKIWTVMATDYALEGRLHTLEVKLHQIEAEAKFDVKARAGRRSRKLEQSIVWLLVASCMLAGIETLKKGSMFLSKYSASEEYSSSSTADGSGQVDQEDGAGGSSGSDGVYVAEAAQF